MVNLSKKALWIILSIIYTMPAIASPAKLYVSTDGNDSWNGLYLTHKSGINGPLLTLEAARDILRSRRKEGRLAEGAVIYLRKGTYLLQRTLLFGPEDSGTEKYPVNISAYKNETVTIGGGRRITDWQPISRGMYRAPLPMLDGKQWIFRELFVNSEPL